MNMSVAKTVERRTVETLPLYDAKDLTQGGDLAQIQLADQVYTLPITPAGKLILTQCCAVDFATGPFVHAAEGFVVFDRYYRLKTSFRLQT